ncbi:MAG: TetR-like C-terminal domain-containing protein [Pseudomonadota bacterium]
MNDKQPSKREAKKEALKAALLKAAHDRIAESGLEHLRARDITADAGCALGGLYNAYKDLDNLVLHVNSITLGRLGNELAATAKANNDPLQRLVELARGYLAFACDNLNQWSALFDHRMPDGQEVPDWHLAEHAVLFEHIVEPLIMIDPDLTENEVATLSRSLFAAVHGIISVCLQERFIAVPREELDRQVTEFVNIMVRGIKKR